MTDYIPKVGDKVRATLGENVLVGRVSLAGKFYLEIDLSSEVAFGITEGEGWRIEPILELPTLPGAVIECEGQIWMRNQPNSYDPWVSYEDKEIESDQRPDGYFTGKQFTVHFAGVQK